MSTLSQFGGGSGGHIFTQFFPASTTYTIPATGKYRIGVLGAGGSGGASGILLQGRAAVVVVGLQRASFRWRLAQS